MGWVWGGMNTVFVDDGSANEGSTAAAERVMQRM